VTGKSREGELHGGGQGRETERTHENTVIGLLSHGAHGLAAVLIIDVGENLH